MSDLIAEGTPQDESEAARSLLPILPRLAKSISGIGETATSLLTAGPPPRRRPPGSTGQNVIRFLSGVSSEDAGSNHRSQLITLWSRGVLPGVQ